MRISLNDSRAHAQSLKLELLCNAPHASTLGRQEQGGDVAKQQKAAIIKVSSELELLKICRKLNATVIP